MGRRLALLIATYKYQDAGLRQLTAPAHDAEALAEVLRDPDIAGFEVKSLVNRPHHEVGEAIGDLFRDRRPDDLTLLYFTGHGLKDDTGRLHLATTNTRRDNLPFTSLPAEQIDQAMNSCMSRRKVVILDCCYSGAFPAGRLAKADADVHALEPFDGHGRTVLTASNAIQYSFEGDKVTGQAAQSVFTRHLVQGLRDGSADLDRDGVITLDELYGYVYDKVVEEMPQQRPKRMDNVEGRIRIAWNIQWDLPPHLQQAIHNPSIPDRLSAMDDLARLHRTGSTLVRQRVEAELRALSDDDSRTVSTAATALLSTFPGRAAQPPPVATPVATPEPPETRDDADSSSSTVSLTAPKSATPHITLPPFHVPISLTRRQALRIGAAATASGVLLRADQGSATSSIPPRRPPGKVRWQYATKGTVQSSPTVANGVAYVGSNDQSLYAIDVTTGKRLWRYPTGSSVYSSPTVVKGIVYVGSEDHNLYAIDATTGHLRWQYATGEEVYSSPTVVNGVIYVGSNDRNLYAIEATTRSLLWKHTTGDLVFSSPTVVDKVVYVGSKDKYVYAIDTTTGIPLWRGPAGGSVYSSPTVVNGVLFIGSDDHNLYAVNAASGVRLWQYPTGGHVDSSPTVVDGVVYIGSDDHNLYAINAATGQKRWRYTTGGAVYSSPTVADGVVYVSSGDNSLHAVDTTTGIKRWRYTTDGIVYSSPTVVDGVVYVGSNDGNLYAINATSNS